MYASKGGNPVFSYSHVRECFQAVFLNQWYRYKYTSGTQADVQGYSQDPWTPASGQGDQKWDTKGRKFGAEGRATKHAFWSLKMPCCPHWYSYWYLPCHIWPPNTGVNDNDVITNYYYLMVLQIGGQCDVGRHTSSRSPPIRSTSRNSCWWHCCQLTLGYYYWMNNNTFLSTFKCNVTNTTMRKEPKLLGHGKACFRGWVS